MKPYCFTPAARNDVFEIWKTIAEADLIAADRLEEEILDACVRIAARRDIGHFRRDLTKRPVRFFTVHRNYMVVYDPGSDPLIIIRVLHGARDVSGQLSGRD